MKMEKRRGESEGKVRDSRSPNKGRRPRSQTRCKRKQVRGGKKVHKEKDKVQRETMTRREGKGGGGEEELIIKSTEW